MLDAVQDHLRRGDLHDGLVYDAVQVRPIEIGEAVKGIDADLVNAAPDVPWREIARMRDHLAHRYFDTDHAIVQDVVDNDLDPLLGAVHSLIERTQEADEA
ncbi:MAG: DUF86 domain-containing protein [Acidimicrobiia bacterium]|nr:DUF86 domain-containing protein [Acidimicrobiia bacterium]